MSGVNLGVLVVAQDLATACCGLLNAGYFSGYWLRHNGFGSRRLGAFALALVSAAAVSGSLFSQSLFWSAGEPSFGVWALLRLPLLLSTVLVSGIVVRRLAG